MNLEFFTIDMQVFSFILLQYDTTISLSLIATSESTMYQFYYFFFIFCQCIYECEQNIAA
jgi:hypothetical protein